MSEDREYKICYECMWDREYFEWVPTRWCCECCGANVTRTATKCWRCGCKLIPNLSAEGGNEMSSLKKKSLWAIYHEYDLDGGYGDAIPSSEMVGIVMATNDEIADFIKKYNKPIVYDKPYNELCCHVIRVEKIDIIYSLDEVKPYGPDDYYGERAEEYQLDKKFEETYGEDWVFKDEDGKLHELRRKEMDDIAKKWAERRNENGRIQ